VCQASIAWRFLKRYGAGCDGSVGIDRCELD
jgi:hypothetical protein